MKKNTNHEAYPASEEPLVQAFIKKFFAPPLVNERIILHKNGKVTRNGYEVIVVSSEDVKNRVDIKNNYKNAE